MVDELRRYRFAEPFRPFIVELRDGRTIPVHRPLAFGWNEQGGVGGAFLPDDTPMTFSLLDVKEVRPLESAA